ncbi:hypothetical protein BSU04_11915 [Caballeronia sordidicola]|jgi:hypothetical protein|uniref:Uncharacterized protein n=1 Tax=Caballeronia sordidicola TaxID=196367 RepID=A0A226X648_CABSO|nr:hypothetical protein BSU04_11915 [Caballeronia sordidicola]
MNAARAGGAQAIKHSAEGDDGYMETMLAGSGGRSLDVHIRLKRNGVPSTCTLSLHPQKPQPAKPACIDLKVVRLV